MTDRYSVILRHLMREIANLEQSPDHTGDFYGVRNNLILRAAGAAAGAGIPIGICFDPKEPEWPCVMFELPTGQVGWHLPQHKQAYDGHSDEEKWKRIRQWLK